MHVFVTGATGHIGSAVVPLLLEAGHQVTGLVRSREASRALRGMGAGSRRGDLDDLAGLRAAAADADGVLHLAFRDDLMRAGDLEGAIATDLAAIRTFGEALAGTGKALVGVSALLTLAGLGRPSTEDDTLPAGPRIDSENLVVSLAERGVRSSVVRLSPVTHSPVLERHGFLTALIDTARETGVSAYIGTGENRWPAAHTHDTARLIVATLLRAPAGTRVHAAAEPAITTKAIASAIADHLELPLRSIDNEDAGAHFGFLAPFMGLDGPASSDRTQRLLGWRPAEAGLLADLRDPRYYAESASKSGGRTPVAAARPRVLNVGLEPARAGAAGTAFPAGDAETVQRGLARTRRALDELGLELDDFLVGRTDGVDALFRKVLLNNDYEMIVIGGGVRLEPSLTHLFETLVNCAVANSPRSTICCNTGPETTVDAIRRWWPNSTTVPPLP